MVELDDAMRRALLAREDPPLEARDAILASLRSQLGGPIDPGSGESGPGSPEGLGLAAANEGARWAWAAKVVGATVGLTVGGLLTLKLGAMAIAGVGDDDDGRETPVVVVESKQVGEADPQPMLPETTSIAEPEPAANTDSAPELRSAPPSDPPEDEASTLAAELALVRAAKQARADDREAALAQLELHRERFPAGVLAPEREKLRIELLCELGRDIEAERCTNVGTDSKHAGD